MLELESSQTQRLFPALMLAHSSLHWHIPEGSKYALGSVQKQMLSVPIYAWFESLQLHKPVLESIWALSKSSH
jgi:hypothetical protein